MTNANRPAVLVVDDERHMRTTLAEILETEGYQVETADSGEEAVQRCDQRTFDVVLMDVRMPGINGVEAFRRIREHNKQARVVLMSAFTVDDLRRVALEEGAAALLPKPLNLDTVTRLIEHAEDATVLVVGNDDSADTTITDALVERGCHVSRCESATEALELAAQIHFDVVFIESQLATMSGLDFYVMFRKVTPSVIAVMVSDGSAAEDEIANSAVDRSAYTVVHKPVNVEKLIGLLDRIAGQRVSDDVHKPGRPQPSN
ncbi:MAG: response regulator [Planctomycetota bacterium]